MLPVGRTGEVVVGGGVVVVVEGVATGRYTQVWSAPTHDASYR